MEMASAGRPVSLKMQRASKAVLPLAEERVLVSLHSLSLV